MPQSKRSKREAEAKQEEQKDEPQKDESPSEEQPDEVQEQGDEQKDESPSEAQPDEVQEQGDEQKDESPSEPQEVKPPDPQEHIRLREGQVQAHNERTGGGKVREGELQKQLDYHNQRVGAAV